MRNRRTGRHSNGNMLCWLGVTASSLLALRLSAKTLGVHSRHCCAAHCVRQSVVVVAVGVVINNVT